MALRAMTSWLMRNKPPKDSPLWYLSNWRYDAARNQWVNLVPDLAFQNDPRPERRRDWTVVIDVSVETT